MQSTVNKWPLCWHVFVYTYLTPTIPSPWTPCLIWFCRSPPCSLSGLSGTSGTTSCLGWKSVSGSHCPHSLLHCPHVLDGSFSLCLLSLYIPSLCTPSLFSGLWIAQSTFLVEPSDIMEFSFTFPENPPQPPSWESVPAPRSFIVNSLFSLFCLVICPHRSLWTTCGQPAIFCESNYIPKVWHECLASDVFTMH